MNARQPFGNPDQAFKVQTILEELSLEGTETNLEKSCNKHTNLKDFLHNELRVDDWKPVEKISKTNKCAKQTKYVRKSEVMKNSGRFSELIPPTEVPLIQPCKYVETPYIENSFRTLHSNRSNNSNKTVVDFNQISSNKINGISARNQDPNASIVADLNMFDNCSISFFTKQESVLTRQGS